MACDHNSVTNTVLGDKYILVHCDGKLIMAQYTGGITSSCHEVEVLPSAQALLDRGLALGLTCSIDQVLTAAEHGAVLNVTCEAFLHSEVWTMDMDFIARAESLGYTNPN